MALPSSPPLLPDEIDLPDAPSLQPLTSHSNAPIGALNRKRQHSDYGSLSSDPLFSDTTEDDDHPATERPRRKKLIRGPWWNVGRRSRNDLRRSMARKETLRNADSGVWMGSDESEESIDSVLSSQQRLQELAVDDDEGNDTEPDETTILDAEAYAARVVHECLDRGKEVVYLGDLALHKISDATLRPLHQLIRPSFTELTCPPSEDEFGPLTPSITLILSTNRLTSLPAELFNLSNITVLSLRNNHIACIPPAIAALKKLQELNVASNNIRYLPWELLPLFERSDSVNVRPNPLLEPTDLSGPSPLPKPTYNATNNEDLSRFADTKDTVEKLRQKYEREGCLNLRGELELRLKLGRMLRMQHLQEASRAGKELKLFKEEMIYLASSAVRYFGVDGLPLRTSRLVASQEVDWSATTEPTKDKPESFGSNSAPSLFELALRCVQGSNDLTDFLPSRASSSEAASEYGLPASVTAGLSRAASNAAANGNETCSTCGRQYILARAEWMEYWFHGYPSRQLGPESTLPFLRRACSWACARPSEAGTFRC